MSLLPILIFKMIMMAFTAIGPGERSVPTFKEGVVIYAGDESEDGCGWLLKIEDEYFKPRNLAEVYRKENLKVKLDIDFSMKLYQCDGMEGSLQEVIISWIEPKTSTEDPK